MSQLHRMDKVGYDNVRLVIIVNMTHFIMVLMPSHSSHRPQEVLLAQFSLYVPKSGLNFHFHFIILPMCHEALSLFRSLPSTNMGNG